MTIHRSLNHCLIHCKKKAVSESDLDDGPRTERREGRNFPTLTTFLSAPPLSSPYQNLVRFLQCCNTIYIWSCFSLLDRRTRAPAVDAPVSDYIY
jgi:hypothetical protein